MRVVKPNQIGVLSRPFDHNNKYQLCVTGMILFPFAEPRYPMTESALWMLVGKELGETALDESMPKQHGEILMRANAYAPGGKPHAVVRVAVELEGKLLKEVAVVGDRAWKDSVPTPPEPFVTKRIQWEDAFGGEGFKPNPLGKGYAAKDGTPLPSIEDPKKLLTSMRQTPEPVGVGPYDLTRSQRLEKAGTYDKEWLEKFYPGLARNIDWTFFNVAPLDQQIPGFFRGDERLVLKNLHPSIPDLACKLPEVQLRCFIRRKPRSGAEVESEVEMRLDTVWLFPHAAHGIIVFHGAAPVREDDASDVTTLYLACEDLGRPKPREHYSQELERRLSREHGAVASLDDRPLMPDMRADMKHPPRPYDEMAELCELEHLSYKNLMKKGERQIEETRSRLIAYGLDPDQHGPPPLEVVDTSGSLEEQLTRMDKMAEEMNEQRRLAEETLVQKEQQAKKICEEAGLDFEEIQKEWRGPFKGGPPEPSAEKDIAKLKQLADDSRAAGFDASEIDAYFADPEFMQRIRDQDRVRLEAYRMGAQEQSEPELRNAEASRRLREELLSSHQRGLSLAGRDLTGADLSGIELPGADLEEALMERCDLSNANLTGANLKRAVLVRANLSEVRLDGSNLTGANLSKANCVSASLVDCNLTEAQLIQARLVAANLDGIELERAVLTETTLERCSLRRVRAHGVLFDGLDLTGTSFVDAVLSDGMFMKCTLDRVDFTGANLSATTLFACRATGAVFVRVIGKTLRVVEGSELSGCDFREANLEEACLRGTNLTRSDFTDARASMADFSDCNMQDACLYHLVAKQARFIRTELSGANMTGADLFEAVLSKAIVCGTNMSGSNLYQADMSMVRGDDKTQMRDAIVLRARIKPLYSDKVQDLD